MISKILLCERPHFAGKPKPDHFLCSAFIFFKENLPLTYGYCEILQDNNDIFIKTNGWYIPSESFIQSVHLYVRNKLEDIKAGRLLTAKEAIKQKDIILRKHGLFEDTIGALTEEEVEIMSQSPEDKDEMTWRAAWHMALIEERVNAAWKK